MAPEPAELGPACGRGGEASGRGDCGGSACGRRRVRGVLLMGRSGRRLRLALRGLRLEVVGRLLRLRRGRRRGVGLRRRGGHRPGGLCNRARWGRFASAAAAGKAAVRTCGAVPSMDIAAGTIELIAVVAALTPPPLILPPVGAPADTAGTVGSGASWPLAAARCPAACCAAAEVVTVWAASV